MKGKIVWTVSALVIIMTWHIEPSYTQNQEKGKATKKTAAAKKGAPSMDEMMAEYAKYGAPGLEHQRIKALEGSWSTTSKMWMGPGEPKTSNGSSEKKWIHDGRFLQEEFRGEFMGKPFSGMGLLGYDHYKKKYNGIWTDSMATSIWVGLGAGGADGKSVSLIGSFDDVLTGKKKTVRAVTRIVDQNQHIFEWYEPGPDGKEVKTMEVTYTRK